MSSFLSAVLALVGVVVGIAATSWADRIQWKRSQVIRWDERRLDAYAEYAKAVKQTHMIALRIARPDRPDNLTRAIDRETALEILTEAAARQTDAWELLLLLSDQTTAHAALQWRNVVRREAEFALSHPVDAGSDEWLALVRSVDKARDLFYVAARNSINVNGGSVAMAEVLRSGDRASTGIERSADT